VALNVINKTSVFYRNNAIVLTLDMNIFNINSLIDWRKWILKIDKATSLP